MLIWVYARWRITLMVWLIRESAKQWAVFNQADGKTNSLGTQTSVPVSRQQSFILQCQYQQCYDFDKWCLLAMNNMYCCLFYLQLVSGTRSFQTIVSLTSFLGRILVFASIVSFLIFRFFQDCREMYVMIIITLKE